MNYDEIDASYERFIKEIEKENPKVIVIDETLFIDLGDEEIQKHLGTIVYYDKQWIEKFNPNYENFEEWLIEFIDELIFSKH